MMRTRCRNKELHVFSRKRGVSLAWTAISMLAVLLVGGVLVVNRQPIFAATLVNSTASGSFSRELPERAINVSIQAWGGGGGGGGVYCPACLFTYAESGGGGGGGYISKTLTKVTTDPKAKPIVSGTIGQGGSTYSGAVNGDSGGNTVVTVTDTTLTAVGGGGGYGRSGNGQSNGGTGGVTPGGTNGGNGTKGGSGGGAGGSSPTGGSGGPGASRGSCADGGGSGIAPGGGGGGACQGLVGGSQQGGNGANGGVIVTYDIAPLPTLSMTSINASSGVFSGGNTATITGVDFIDFIGDSTTRPLTITGVEFGTNSATNVSVLSDSTLSLTVPSYSSTNISANTPVDVTITYTDQYGFIYSTTRSNFYTYVPAAKNYRTTCYDTEESDWVDMLYVPQNTTVQCRIVLDGPFDGGLSVSDDYDVTTDIYTSLPALTGTIVGNPSDSRYSNGRFNLTYANTFSVADRTLYFTYTPPNSSTIHDYYEDIYPTNDEIGDVIWWPSLIVDQHITNPALELQDSGRLMTLGLTADEYWIYPVAGQDICQYCVTDFVLSTRGAPYFGTITIAEDLLNSDNPSGTSGTIDINGSPTTSIDMSDLDGVDAGFSYTPMVTATAPTNTVTLYGSHGSSDPAITDGSATFHVDEAPILIEGPSALARGETGTYTLTAYFPNWPTSIVVSLSDGGLGGAIVDISSSPNPTGTYDPLTQSYTFTPVAGETFSRTFTYTMVANPPSSNMISLTASSLSPEASNVKSVAVKADKISTLCSNLSPNCQYGYVGELQDYRLVPNGNLSATGTLSLLSSNSIVNSNSLGSQAAQWSSAPFVVSYTPSSPGKKAIKTHIDTANIASMVDEDYYSYDAGSIGYIYVMANAMSIAGPTEILSGTANSYTLTLNGPFIGRISLEDFLSDETTSASGQFSTSYCDFTLSNYNETANTTSCAFTYTPAAQTTNTVVILDPSESSTYGHTLIGASKEILVRSPLTISSISPERGGVEGGTVISITGSNFLAIGDTSPDSDYSISLASSSDVGGGSVCSIVSYTDTLIQCAVGAHSPGATSVHLTNGEESDIWRVGGNRDNEAYPIYESGHEGDPEYIIGYKPENGFYYLDVGLSISATPVRFEVTPTASNSGKLDVSAQSNNPTGYQLLIRTHREAGGSIENGDLNLAPTAACESSTAGISPLGSNNVALSDNTWGWQRSGSKPSAGSTTWQAPSLADTQFVTSSQMSGPQLDGADFDDYQVWFGAKVDHTMPVCSYENTVVVTLITPP